MKLIAAILISCLSFVGMLSAQDLNITGAGARAEGFGGAFIGVADDATAIVWNPAGLNQLERAEASIVSRIIMEKEETNYLYSPEFNSSASQSHVVFNFGSVALPIHMGGTKLVIALAYQRQLDFYRNQKTTTTNLEGKGGVDTFTPGFSINLGPVISVGASANFWMGKYDETSTYTGLVNQQPLSPQTQNFTYKGFNIVAGGLVDLEGLPAPVPLKFGVCLRTPFNMTADGTINNVPNISFGPTNYSVSQTIHMPFMLGFGASARLFENLTLAADYETRSYGDKEIQQDISGQASQTFTISKNNLNQYRFGAEYLIVGQKVVIPIRIGYQSLPTVNQNFNSASNPTDQVIGKAVSIGSGLIFTSFAIDAAYTSSDYTINYEAYGSQKFTTGTVSASLIVYM
jgi:hypothetical protein